MKVEKVLVFKDHARQYRWTSYAGNGEPVADSDEGYTSKFYTYGVVGDLFPGVPIEGEDGDER